MMSFGPPAGNGTISLIGLFGKSCAAAKPGNSSTDNPIASAPRVLMLARGRTSAVEQFERRFMHARIAGRDDAAAALGGLALPRGHDAAGAGDDRNQRRDVVGL